MAEASTFKQVQFVCEADTPEQMRDEMVAWLKREATDRDARARYSTTKRRMNDLQSQGAALAAAATFFEGLTIEPKAIELKAIQKHMEERLKGGSVQCPHCKWGFANDSVLKQHIKEKHR